MHYVKTAFYFLRNCLDVIIEWSYFSAEYKNKVLLIYCCFYLFIYSFIYLFIYLFTCLFIYLFLKIRN